MNNQGVSALYDRAHMQKVLETALLVANEPLSLHALKSLFAEETNALLLNGLLDAIQQDWAGRGIELVKLATGWRFRARLEMQPYLERLNPEKNPRVIRARLWKRWPSLPIANRLRGAISKKSVA